MKLKIEHNRQGCIGCCACAAIAPDFWVMEQDGKSSIINSKHIIENEEIKKEELFIEEKDLAVNKEAAESCPVNVIHLIKDGKKII